MELKQKVVHGFGWMAGGKFVGQLFSWAVTVIVIRLLTPGDYGLMALATLLLTLLNLIAELGLSFAIIQIENLTEKITRQCFGMILVINVSLFLIFILTSTYTARFFNEPELAPVIQVISFSFLLAIFSIVPEALLEREMNFKKISIINFIATIIGAIATLILALLDYGVWALVWGNIALVFAKTVAMNITNDKFILPSFDFTGMRKIMSFSTAVAMDRTLFFIYTQADIFLIGKFLGKDLLGIYSVAAHIASLPMHKIMGSINQVAFPAFSSIQSDKQSVSNYTLKASRMMCLATFPVFWGVSSISPEFVNIILGKKWEDAILPLQLLTLIMPLRMLNNIMSIVLYGIGSANVALVNLIISSVIMISAFYVGLDWGIIGVCYAWITMFPVVFFITTFRTMRILDTEYLTFIKTTFKPFLAGIGMYMAVYATRLLLPEELNSVLLFSTLIIVGALTYLAIILTIANELRIEVFGLLRK
jgi:O-antigen/teichoic acid export membrane protein